ncbi:HEAT repeat domain-containing protein [Methylomonas sp. MgM2]
MEGLEQLTAYPSPQSEQMMVDILQTDMSDEMRALTADYLSYIEEPSLATQNALIDALNDRNEDVRSNALNTLESYLASLDEDSATARRIVNSLKKQSKNKQLPGDIRQEIKAYLSEQDEN